MSVAMWKNCILPKLPMEMSPDSVALKNNLAVTQRKSNQGNQLVLAKHQH